MQHGVPGFVIGDENQVPFRGDCACHEEHIEVLQDRGPL